MNTLARISQVPASLRRWMGTSFASASWLPAVLAFSASWLLTYLFGNLFWGSSLPRAAPGLLALGFLVPLLLVVAIAVSSTRCMSPGTLLRLFLLLGLLIVPLNAFVLHLPLMNYGDNGALARYTASGRIFARWLIGSSLLTRSFRSGLLPLIDSGLIPVSLTADIFVRLAGSIVMIVSSALFLSRYPRRFAVLLPLTTPIWILLSSGYSEYYPFIAPAFLGALLFLSEYDVKNIQPWAAGLLAAGISLLYVGFVPIGGLILLMYAVRRGVRAGIQAAALAGTFALLLIFLLWPGNGLTFASQYRHEMNLGEMNTSFLPYEGKAWGQSIFFVPAYVFSRQHMGDLFYMYFWAGGLSPFLLAIGGFLLRRRLRLALLKDFRFVGAGILVIWQFVYFLFMIPKLGPREDIDLFFSVYIACAFVSGILIDALVQDARPEIATLVRNLVFSVVVAGSAVVIIYLMALGIPARPQ